MSKTLMMHGCQGSVSSRLPRPAHDPLPDGRRWRARTRRPAAHGTHRHTPDCGLLHCRAGVCKCLICDRPAAGLEVPGSADAAALGGQLSEQLVCPLGAVGVLPPALLDELANVV